MRTAITSAADGSKVTVIAKDNQLSLPDDIYVAQADKGITLDLNGHSLGGYSINVGGITATSKPRSGKLTVIDGSSGNGAVGITVRNNGTFVFSPGNEHTTLLQLQVYGGDIVLNSGKISSNGLYLFNDITLDSLLPANKGLAYRGAIHYTTWIPMTSTQNKAYRPPYDLVVTMCEHKGFDSDGKCLYCGTTCTHSNGFTDGKCNDCGEPCPHTNIDEAAAACSTCGMKMIVKTDKTDGTISYGTDLATAVDTAENGETVTLLRDAELRNNAYVYGIGKKVTLNLNGHSVIGDRMVTLDVGGTEVENMNLGGTLAIVGEGDILKNLNVWDSGTLDLSGWTGEKLNYLSIYENTSVIGMPSEAYIGGLDLICFTKNEVTQIKRCGGSCGVISWINFGRIKLSLGNLLAPGYAFQREDNTFVPYADTLDDFTTSINNVKVVKCENHAVSNSDGKCDYCNTQLAASVEKQGGVKRFYTNLKDAVDALEDGVHTITLFDNASGSYTATKGSVDFMLNGKKVNELVFAGSASVSIKNNNGGTVNSVVFKGVSAGFKTLIPVLGKITIEDGATWKSILPNKGEYDTYGYMINNSDGTHSWYDKYTIGSYAGESTSINNAGVKLLPVTSEPQLKLDNQTMAEESTVDINKPLVFSFNSWVTDGWGGKGLLYIKSKALLHLKSCRLKVTLMNMYVIQRHLTFPMPALMKSGQRYQRTATHAQVKNIRLSLRLILKTQKSYWKGTHLLVNPGTTARLEK